MKALSIQRAANLSVVLLGLAIVAIGGCFSSDEGEALQRDVAELKKKLAAESGNAEQARQELQKVLEQATALLTRNSADVGAQVERIQTATAKLQGQIEELNKSIEDLKQKLNQLQAKVDVNTEATQAAGNTQAVMPDKDTLYASGRQKTAAGEHVEGRKLLRQFLNSFGGDPRAATAQRLLGDSYYAEQKFAPAIVEYRKVLEQHKTNGREVAEALYKVGMSFYQLKFCGDAKDFLQQFTSRFRRHKQATAARRVLKLIRRYRNNRQFCRP
jgi:TolA-binding protein